MTEAILQADLQRELLALTATFSSGDVTIGDWSILDGSSLSAPFAIVEIADDFTVEGVESEAITRWQIPFSIIVRFTDWDASMLEIGTLRQTVLAKLVDTVHYDASSTTLAWGLRGISSNTGINEVYDRYNDNTAESLPVYLSQRIILDVEEI